MHLHFVIPDPAGFRSGGNIYNEELILALRREGVVATWSAPDQCPAADLYLVDTLYAKEWGAARPGPAWLIVHHLVSLFPPEGYTGAAYFRDHERSWLTGFDGFLATSAFTQWYLRELDIGDRPIVVVSPALKVLPNVPVRDWSPVRAVMVANLVERKGVLPFLWFLAAGLKGGNTASLQVELIGEATIEPEYARKCRALIESSSLAGVVRYRGSLPAGQVEEAYRSANLFLSASFMETFGMAIYEARTWGLPLLVHQGGYAGAHVREGINGYVVTSPAELVDRLLQLAVSPDNLRRLGQIAAEQAAGTAVTWQERAGALLRQLADHGFRKESRR